MENARTASYTSRHYADDHQVGSSGATAPERFLTAAGLQQTIPTVSEQRCNETQIDRSVLDDKNRGHDLPRFPSYARRARFGPFQTTECEMDNYDPVIGQYR